MKVKALSVGYYGNKKRKEGEIFHMLDLDAEGYYLDADGKRALFKGKGDKLEPRKCKWVTTDLKALPSKDRNPQAVARAISGKFPPQKKGLAPAESFEELEGSDSESVEETAGEEEGEAFDPMPSEYPEEAAEPKRTGRGHKKK